MDLNEITQEIHRNAVEHGWWDEPRSFGEIVALCHSELSEALEEYRAGYPLVYGVIPEDFDITTSVQTIEARNLKPEGMGVEMVDCLIRILDWFGRMDLDVEEILAIKHEYNKTRPYRHGGKVI